MPTGVTVVVVAPAVPPIERSPLTKPVTFSLKITVKLTVVAAVGSSCVPAWLIVTVGGVMS